MSKETAPGSPFAERITKIRQRQKGPAEANQVAEDRTWLEEQDWMLEPFQLLPEKEFFELSKGKGEGIQQDMFVLDIFDASLKSDAESMQIPLFALQTRDIKPYRWESKNGAIQVTITPPTVKEGEDRAPGRATIHDKDILIFLTSALVAGINNGESLPSSRRVRFTAHSFFQATGRDCSKDAYERLKAALERLARTYVRIHYRDRKVTLWKQKDEGFNLVAYWSAITDERDDRMSSIVVDLSEPLAEAITQRAVLTLHPDYFKIRKPLAKRLYELGRKHCGKQGGWKIGLETLQHACGSTRELKKFRADMREIIKEDSIPGYTLTLGQDDMVTFYDRDPAKLIQTLTIKAVKKPRKRAVDKS